ncbi:hypothetical protein C7974DRAFT_394405 [Boeremia exigua]|uniref:uncharacterized protein n=1 Tax=Boeremia exigua TaxID=749465 RepID=UPI001E8CD24E|nr:uncharacterized protein C7974DRAFT_394405 [Boeremia exigua]KAH6629400.1 hypothetical protein C7974DRAFT_394405 [Boeremia exigua]
MLRTAPRIIARHSALRAAPPARRFISTAPPAQKSRSWKSLVGRLGIAGAIIYYYNTTDLSEVVAADARAAAPHLATAESDASLPTIESISAARAERRAVQAQLEAQRLKEEEAAAAQQPESSGEAGDIQGLEEQADQQGAFNPETGEINWDCPCLGGMATGPCGEEFKAAFSCFVYSKEEPKGLDCIERFKDMQGCFRQYPEIYGAEIDDDGDDDDVDVTADDVVPAAQNAPALSGEKGTAVADEAETPIKTESKKESKTPSKDGPHSPDKVAENRRELGLVPENYRPAEKEAEDESVVPKAAHDGR